MRYLEDLRDKKGNSPHEGKEFWILGCGKSLDDFPDDFFDDKISIGLNMSFVAFPRLTYFLTGHREIPLLMVQRNPKLVKRTIWVLGWQKDRYNDHPRIPAPPHNGFSEYRDDPIYITKRLEIRRRVEIFREALQPTVEGIIQKKKICHFISMRCILHYGIQCAAFLGAKKITLVGCGARTTKHFYHAQKRGMDEAYAKIYEEKKILAKDGTIGITYSIENQTGKTKRFLQQREGVNLLTEAFAPFGIEVRRYYYESGYENIVVDEAQKYNEGGTLNEENTIGRPVGR